MQPLLVLGLLVVACVDSVTVVCSATTSFALSCASFSSRCLSICFFSRSNRANSLCMMLCSGPENSEFALRAPTETEKEQQAASPVAGSALAHSQHAAHAAFPLLHSAVVAR